MPRQTYSIMIYHNGVHWDVPLQGKQRFLRERAFLDELVGHPRASRPRPVPDPPTDVYMLDDAQLDSYIAFRKRMKSSA